MNDEAHRRHDDGRKVYVIGPVERWIIVAVAGAIVTILYGYSNSISNKLDTVVATGSRIEIAQAVSINDINELKSKQAMLQQQVLKIPSMEVQIQANREKLNEHLAKDIHK